MKLLFASLAIASLSLSLSVQAQTAAAPAKPAAKPAVKPAKKSTRPVPVSKAPPTSRRQAIEEATPLEEPDPSIKLEAAELETAKRVHVGEIACELGSKVTIKPLKRDGFFLVARGINRFVMHPVASRTGAIRLEDPARGALWLQLGNKSMLMNQKEGKRLADECVSPEQADFARNMKPVNLLEPAPAEAAAPAASAPAAAAAGTLPAATVPAAATVATTPVAPAAVPAAPVPAAAPSGATPAAPVANNNPTAPAAAAPPAAPAPAQ